jgi:hypothetical protein
LSTGLLGFRALSGMLCEAAKPVVDLRHPMFFPQFRAPIRTAWRTNTYDESNDRSRIDKFAD